MAEWSEAVNFNLAKNKKMTYKVVLWLPDYVLQHKRSHKCDQKNIQHIDRIEANSGTISAIFHSSSNKWDTVL